MLFYSDIPEVHNCTEGFPDRYRHFGIENARQKYYTFASGEMLSQEITTKQFTIYIHQLIATSALLLHLRSCSSCAYVRYVLAGSCSFASDTEGAATIKAGRGYLVCELLDQAYTMHMEEGNLLVIDIMVTDQSADLVFSSIPELLQKIDSFRKSGRSGVIDFGCNIDFRMRTLLHEILSCSVDNPTRELYLNARICELHWCYASQFTKSLETDQRSANLRTLEEVKAYIVGHGVDETFGTAFLSRKFGISATTLKREFKRRFRSSIRDFIAQVRMEGARDMLLHSSLSVGTIGAKAGYAEFSSFSRAFTRYFGQSPTRYRKQFVRAMEQTRLLPELNDIVLNGKQDQTCF